MTGIKSSSQNGGAPKPASGRDASLCVMISGRGSNLEALIEASREPDFPARVELVISDNQDAGGLLKAKSAGITAFACERADFSSKNAHEAAILNKLDEASPDLICLAGYMRILSPSFIERYEGKIINIHPSLLPKYPGLNTHQRALDAGERFHGCTVHYVDQGMDTGPIILQESIEILENDNADSLAARLLPLEHRLYAQAVKKLLN